MNTKKSLVVFLLLLSLLNVSLTAGALRVAAQTCGPNSTQCTITTATSGQTTVVQINRPVVDRVVYDYSAVKELNFQAEDHVTIKADGCVQTGGHGDTWKRYVDPTGANSDAHSGLYHGTVTINGAVNVQGSVPLKNAAPIIDVIGTTWFIPTPTTLKLGYVDNGYGDNGYYSHDNGNNNQCGNTQNACFQGSGNIFGGDACVLITITHHVQPPPQPIPAPFDLVPTSLTPQAFDANSLPLNPRWGWQVNGQPQKSNPDVVCNHFPYADAGNPSGGFTVGSPACTTQNPSYDIPSGAFGGALLGNIIGDIAGGVVGSVVGGNLSLGTYLSTCAIGGNQPLGDVAGHINWQVATYEGKIYWEDHSASTFGDDDYNFLLKSIPANAGATANNPDNIKLEFQARETIDHFDNSSWWHALHTAVDKGDSQWLNTNVNGHDAVVIGLLGLDTVHNSATELHPVYALAIREAAKPSVINDSWAIFVRNWGSEGWCSQNQHYVDMLSMVLNLPAPVISGFQADTVTFGSGNNTFNTNNPAITGPKVDTNSLTGRGEAKVAFTLPQPDMQGRASGEVHLRWTEAVQIGIQAPTHPLASTFPLVPRKEAGAENSSDDDPESVLAAMSVKMTPQQRKIYQNWLLPYEAPSSADSYVSLSSMGVVPLPLPPPLRGRTVRNEPLVQRQLHQILATCATFHGVIAQESNLCSLYPRWAWTTPLHYWAANGNATDAIGTATGALQGNVTYGAGTLGSAFQFDGSPASAVTLGSNVGNFGTRDFALAFSLATTSTSVSGLLGKRTTCDNSNFWDIRMLWSGVIQYTLNDSSLGARSKNYVNIIGHLPVNNGQFHRVTLQRQGNLVEGFVDGNLDVYQQMAAGSTNIQNNAQLTVGRSACAGNDDITKYFSGKIDEIVLYNRALRIIDPKNWSVHPSSLNRDKMGTR